MLPGPKGKIKKKSCSTQLTMKLIMLYVEMPQIVGILTLSSMMITTFESLKARKVFIFQHFSFWAVEISCSVEFYNNLGAWNIAEWGHSRALRCHHVMNNLGFCCSCRAIKLHWALAPLISHQNTWFWAGLFTNIPAVMPPKPLGSVVKNDGCQEEE